MASRLNVALDKRAELKAEGNAILEIAASARTPEQVARLDAIETELVALDKDIERLRKFAADEKAEAKGTVVVGADRAALKPWGPTLHSDATAEMKVEARRAALGEFAIAVKSAQTGFGIDPRLQAAGTGMNVASGEDGGFAIPNEIASGIEREMYELGALLSRVDARSITGNAISYNIFDETSRVDASRQGGVLGYWVDEGTAPTASQFKLARIELKLRKVGALGYMTDELVADAAGLGGELETSFRDELIFQVENAIFRGTGAGQPLGFMTAACLVSVAKEAAQAADTINATNLVKMHARLTASSRRSRSLVWLTNGDCFPQLHNLAFPTASTEVAARFITYSPNGAMAVFGVPVVDVEYAATVGDQGDIALVDLAKYRLIRKAGVEQASSMHVRFTQGEQTFRAFYRVDGQPVPRSAVTPYKGSATRSPFVTLDARA